MHGQNENKYSNDIAILENQQNLATALKICKIQACLVFMNSVSQFNSRVNIYLLYFLIDCLLWIQLYKTNAMKM